MCSPPFSISFFVVVPHVAGRSSVPQAFPLPGQVGPSVLDDAGNDALRAPGHKSALSHSFTRGVVSAARYHADGGNVYSDSDEGSEDSRLEATAPSRLRMPGGRQHNHRLFFFFLLLCFVFVVVVWEAVMERGCLVAVSGFTFRSS